MHACDHGGSCVTVDLSATARVDTVGAAVLWRMGRTLAAEGRALRLEHASAEVAHFLAHFPGSFVPPSPPTLPLSPLQALGDASFRLAQGLLTTAVLARDVVRQVPAFWRAPPNLGGQSVRAHILRMGCHAAPVVMLIAFLVGITVALQSAAQLRQFGAGLLVADLIGVSVTRELGPLMAAILVAGRTGSAIAAELATMVITEELDALRVMGINPVGHLVVPRMAALLVAQPVLTLMANTVAVFGGLCVAVFYLDLSAAAFMHRLQEAVTLKDVYTGIIKSAVFAALIVITGAVSGLNTQGGPDAVGRSTTQSVVAAIFAIIVADAVASMVFFFGSPL